MDVWAITVAVLRRWYVFLPLLILSVLAALFVGSRAPEQYQVRATVVLVPGPEPTEIPNPYGGLGETGQILQILLASTATREDFEERGLDHEYQVEALRDTHMVTMRVTADSEQVALDTAGAMIEFMSERLAARQDEANLPEGSQTSVDVLEAPVVTGTVSEGRTRNMAIVGVAGAALSLLVAVLFDDVVGLLRRRRRQREA